MKGYEKRNELKKGVHGGELKYLLTKYDFWIFHFSTEFTLRLATRRSFTGFHAGDWLSRNQSENRKKREKSIVRGRRTRWHGRETRKDFMDSFELYGDATLNDLLSSLLFAQVFFFLFFLLLRVPSGRGYWQPEREVEKILFLFFPLISPTRVLQALIKALPPLQRRQEEKSFQQ